MHYDMLCGILSGVDGTIANWILKNVFIKGYDTVDKLTKLSQSIRPVYTTAVQSGYPVYHIDDPASGRTLDRVVSMTGLPKEVVLNYLASLEEMATSGLIALDVWNPILPKPATGIEAVAQKATSAISGGISSGFNKILLVGGVVALIYLFGRKALQRL